MEGKELWRPGGKALAAVKPGAAGDLIPPDEVKLHPSVAWLQPNAGTYLPTELAYDGGIHVRTHTGILTRFDAKTGVQTYKARVGGGGKVLCIDEEGRTYFIRAGDKYELLETNDLGEMALATPALIGERLILRTAQRRYSIRDASSN